MTSRAYATQAKNAYDEICKFSTFASKVSKAIVEN